MRIWRVLFSLFCILGASGLSGCINPDYSQIDNGFLGGVKLEPNKSEIIISSSTLASGESVTITLTTRDQNGAVFRSPDPLPVNFILSGGTSTGTLEPVVDHRDGTYLVKFKALTSGTPLTVSALVAGVPVTGTLPRLTITASTTVSALLFSSLPSGSGNTDTDLLAQPVLQAKDANGNTVASFGGNISLNAYSDATCATLVPGGLQAAANPAPSLSGVASFSGLRILKTNVVRIGASDGVHSVCSGALSIIAGAPASISVYSGNTQTGTVGSALSSPFIVLVRDANLNPAPGVTIDWLATSGGGSLSSASNSTNASGLSSSILTLGSSAGGNTASATVNGTALSTSFSATSSAGSATKLVFSTQASSSAIAGAALATQPVVTIQDASSNTVTTSSANVTLSLFSDPTCATAIATAPSGVASIGGTITVAGSSGIASFSGLSIKVTGDTYFKASSPGLSSACSSVSAISPAGFSLSQSLLAVSNGSVASGSAITTTLTAKDTYGNANPTGVTAVTYSSSAVGGTGSFGSTSNAGSGVYTAAFTGQVSGAVTLSGLINGGLISATQNVTVGPGAVSTIAFTTSPSTSGNADTALTTQPLVSAKDAAGNVVTGYSSAITLSAFSSTTCTGSVAGGLSATTNPVSASSGVSTFAGLKILKTNVQSLQASDGTRTACFGTLAIAPGAINTISFTTQPAPTTNDTDTAFSTQPVIKAYDANSNLVSNDSASSVALTAYDTAACAGSVVSSGLSGTTTQTLSSGVGTYTDIKAVKVAVKSMKATLGTKTACSSTLTINSGAAASMAFTTQPVGGVDTNSNLPTQPVVTVYDASGNVKSDYVSSITLYANSNSAGCSMVSDVGSGISGNTDTASAGVSTYTVARVLKTNTVRLRATDGTLQVCSNTFSITPGVIASLAFSTAPSSSTNTDTAFGTQPVVSAYDANSNLVTTNSTASITLTAYSDACTTAVASGLSATANPVTLSSGSATFANLKALKTNIVRLGASDGTRSVCSSAITVSPGAPNALTISSGNSPTQTIHYGSALGSAFVVLLKDANSNLISSTQINWAVTAGGGSLGSGASVNTDSSGLSSNLLTTGTPGTQTITATVNGYPALTQTFTATATTSAFTQSYPFSPVTPAPTSTYSYDNTKMDFTGGVCRLTPTDQTDDANDTAGFAGGSLSGVAWDSTNGYVRLSNNGGCDGTNLDCAGSSELNSSWTPQWNQIVSYWKLNDPNGTGVVVDSKGNNPGTPISVTFGGTGKLKTSASFNGVNGNTISLGTPASLEFANTTNFTLNTWVKTTDNSGQPLRVLSNGGTSGGTAGGYSLVVNNGIVQFYLNTTSTATNTVWTNSTGTISDGNWHMITVTVNWSTTQIAVYLDGVLRTDDYSSGCGSMASGVLNFSACASLSANHTVPYMIGSNNGGRVFNGSIDDVAIWGSALTAAEVSTIYKHQTSTRSGLISSRVMDALSTGQSWTTLSWISTLPFFKALPDYASGSIQNENAADYSSLVGSTGTVGDNNLMSGIVGLWHLDGSGSIANGASVPDSSGNARNGTASNSNGSGMSYSNGILNQGISFDAVDDSINLPGTVNPWSGDFTVSTWAYTQKNPNDDGFGGYNGVLYKESYNVNGFRMGIWGNQWRFWTVESGGTINLWGPTLSQLRWNHLVVTFKFSTSTATLYVNGTAAGASSGTYVAPSGGALFGNAGGWKFSGLMDELGIWSRALDPKEILQLYRRGANRIKHQVRVCTASDCSDDATGANWKGPDGTNQTYFSELNNMSVQAAVSSGTVKKTLPSMLFSNFTSPVGTSRYFQYRTILESDDTGTGCNYGLGATWCSPELKSVTVDPVHYDTSSPSVIGKTGVSFYSLASFTETLGASCASGIGYNLGVGTAYSSATWYYWNGSTWAAANGTAAQSNAASVIATNASSFSGVAGTGTVYFKAYLKSSGSSKCELDQLDFGGQQ